MSFSNPTVNNTLDPLNFGTSSGAETTNTLGVDKLNRRLPADTYHLDHFQINQIKNLLILITQYLAGGNRIKILLNAANQFAAGESGLYIDNSGNLKYVFNGGSPISLTNAGANQYLPLGGGTMTGAITLSGTQLGTYTLGGTPTIASATLTGTTTAGGSTIDANGYIKQTDTTHFASVTYTAPSLINSWANIGGSFGVAGYYKDPLGYVHLTGLVGGGSVSTTIFVLPAGFRPAANLPFATWNATGNACRVDVQSSGNVQFQSGATVDVGLDGITFLATQ